MAITLSTTTPKNESGHTSSLWMDASWLSNNWPTLTSDAQADVCVVGAGIAGLTTAYLLSLEGKSVIVLEGGQIAQGESARTTAQLVNALDNRYFRLEELHGASGARLAAESHTAAIDRIEAIVSKENISCDFERLDGYLFASPEDTTDVLDRELDAAHRCGLKDIAFAPRAPLVSGFDTGRCLRFPRQAQFQPLLYLEALAQAVKRNGGRIFTQTQVKEFKGGSPNEVITGNGLKVSANDLVVATNTPVNDWVTMHTKQAAYRSYVVGMRVPKGTIAKALYWDTADPFHYVRLQSAAHHDVLIVGGEDSCHPINRSVSSSTLFDYKRLDIFVEPVACAPSGTTSERLGAQPFMFPAEKARLAAMERSRGGYRIGHSESEPAASTKPSAVDLNNDFTGINGRGGRIRTCDLLVPKF